MINLVNFLLVNSVLQGKPFRIEHLIWIICSFIMAILFGNEMLSRILVNPKEVIDNIKQLNDKASSITLIVWIPPYNANKVDVISK